MSGSRIFLTDCEGPISRNDNAFELVSHFIPEGDKFFRRISKYDDILADVVKREGYNAGDTLRLIAPFLKAYGLTNAMMKDFAASTMVLMKGAKATLQHLRKKMSTFIISTSFNQYIKALCQVLDFPYENTYCTELNLDAYDMNEIEQNKLKQLREEICEMPLIQAPKDAKSITSLSERDQHLVERLNTIFWKQIHQMESVKIMNQVKPMGGVQKAKAAMKISSDIGNNLSNALYVGDSITDMECFRLVREKGGIAVSFNGNSYAIRASEIAILSENTSILTVIALLFNQLEKDVLLELIDGISYETLVKQDLPASLLATLKGKFPRIERITSSNIEGLTDDSEAFRKCIRGEKIGRLG